MATYTWKGGQGTGADPNDASVGANWITSDGTTAIPGAGDTIIEPPGLGAGLALDFLSGSVLTDNSITAGSGDVISFSNAVTNGGALTGGTGLVLNLYDSTLNGTNLSLANGTTIDATGDTAQTGTLFSQGTSYATVPGVAITGGGVIAQSGTASSLLFNAVGKVTDDAFIEAASPGGSLTLDVAPLVSAGTTIAGSLMSTNGVLALDENIVITGTTNAGFANDSDIIMDGGTLSLAERQLPVSGAIDLLNAATADISSGMPAAQTMVFSSASDLLKLKTTAQQRGFNAAIAGFQSGDTIELLGVTGLAQSYADGVLTLTQGGTTVGALRFVANQALDSALGADGFTLTTDGTNTFITTDAVNRMLGSVAAGGTVDWGTSALWGGSVPGATDVADIAFNLAEGQSFLSGGNPKYTFTVSTPETAGAVVLDNPFSTMVILAALTLHRPQAGATGGGDFLHNMGAVDIVAGGTLTATGYWQVSNGQLDIAAGETLALSGQAPSAAAVGWQALDIENSAVIDGQVNASGGAIQIGEDAAFGANVTLENGGTVIATFTELAGGTYGSAWVDVTGANSTWQNVGDAANTLDASPYLGDMIVGGGGINLQGTVTLAGALPNGTANVMIDQGATVSDAGAGILGMVGLGSPANPLNSQSNVTVQNNAAWDIGTQLEVGGSHLYSGAGRFGGTGMLNMQFGGKVLLGAAESAGLYKVVLGATKGSSGTINVQGSDAALDAGGGPIVIGEAGAGSLSVGNSGAVTAFSNATTGFAWAAMIGDQIGSSDTLNLFSDSGNTPGLFTANGNLVVGNDGQGVVDASNSTLTVGGTLFIGGTPSG